MQLRGARDAERAIYRDEGDKGDEWNRAVSWLIPFIPFIPVNILVPYPVEVRTVILTSRGFNLSAKMSKIVAEVLINGRNRRQNRSETRI